MAAIEDSICLTKQRTLYALPVQRWQMGYYDLMPELRQQCGAPTPKLEKPVHNLEWGGIEDWAMQSSLCIGCKPHGRSALANAKAVLELPAASAFQCGNLAASIKNRPKAVIGGAHDFMLWDFSK